MSGIADLSLKIEYRKGRDDIAAAFYIPCMKRANALDRAIGFFSSSIYVLAWEALREFISHSGKIRIVCSPVLSAHDISALTEGYEGRIEEQITDALSFEIDSLLRDPARRKPAIVLATLVRMGIIDVRIAIMTGQSSHERRLFHDKLGLFFDEYGNIVAFKGSMNETWSGLSSDGNLESIDVFMNWADDRDRERVGNNIRDFNALWDNEFPTVSVYPFPKVPREKLLQAADQANWEILVEEIIEENHTAKNISADKQVGGRIPRPHQVKALQAWEARGRRGIFEHATGSGKTFTALCAIRDSLSKGEAVLILVPSELLLGQWYSEVRDTLADILPSLLLCGAGNTSWREPGILTAYTRRRDRASARIVISTIQTAASDDFLNRVSQGAHLFFVADEVHRLGSPSAQKILSIESGPRLGLSATPQRAGDPVGTAAIFQYFRDIVPPPFTLSDAIEAGTLTPYFYYAHPVPLSSDEQEAWNILTQKIRPIYARSLQNPDASSLDYIKHLLIQRSRIAKAATGKIPLATKVVRENYTTGERWIVYCDSQSQLNQVLLSLREAGVDALEYHSSMSGDRERTISNFTYTGGVLVSIRCLDEGVDIPAVTHALILASSKNPREFIQRRGRVLRCAPGKTLAFLHDAIVVPATAEDEGPGSEILLGEIGRALEFGKNALNPSSAHDLELIAIRAGLDYRKLIAEGYEDDGEE